MSSGTDALEFIHQRGKYEDKPRPDIILLDPELPGKRGEEVVSEVKNEPDVSEIPIVALTSSTAGEEILRSRGLNADCYLQKPVEPDEFVDFVQSVEDFWLAIVRESSEE